MAESREAGGVRYQMMALQFSTNGGGAFQRHGWCGWGVYSATMQLPITEDTKKMPIGLCLRPFLKTIRLSTCFNKPTSLLYPRKEVGMIYLVEMDQNLKRDVRAP